MRKVMIAAAALALGTTPAVAQNVDLSGGLVDVTIQDVSILNNFLNDAQIAALNNVGPITVQVPIGVAAAVCGVDANVIARQDERGDYSCPATTANKALAQHVVKQEIKQTD